MICRPRRRSPAIQAHKPIAELSVVLGAWFAVMQHGHNVAARKEILSKGSGLLRALCVNQRPDDLAFSDLNCQVVQLAHRSLAYTLD